MSILLGAIIPYLIATILLCLFWRFLHPKHPYLRLAVIYLALFGIWHVVNALLLDWQAGLPREIEEWLAAAILYISGTGFVLANYTCIEGETPSMILFGLLEEAGPEGLSREAIAREFRELGHVEDRLGGMEGHGLLRRHADGSLSATGRGTWIRWCFDVLFRPLGREKASND